MLGDPSYQGELSAGYVSLSSVWSPCSHMSCLGVMVLDASLRAVGSKYPLVVMATVDLPQDCRDVLNSAGIPIVDVETIYPTPERHSLVDNDHRFRDTWTKLRVFEMVNFDVSHHIP